MICILILGIRKRNWSKPTLSYWIQKKKKKPIIHDFCTELDACIFFDLKFFSYLSVIVSSILIIFSPSATSRIYRIMYEKNRSLLKWNKYSHTLKSYYFKKLLQEDVIYLLVLVLLHAYDYILFCNLQFLAYNKHLY